MPEHWSARWSDISEAVRYHAGPRYNYRVLSVAGRPRVQPLQLPEIEFSIRAGIVLDSRPYR